MFIYFTTVLTDCPLVCKLLLRDYTNSFTRNQDCCVIQVSLVQNSLFLNVEKSQNRKLRRDPVEDSDLVESSSTPTDEINCISEQDFEEITSKVENKMSKRLKETEHCQREIPKLIENLSAKVDNLTNSSSVDPGCSSSRTETHENLQDVLTSEYTDIPEHRNVNSNSWRDYKTTVIIHDRTFKKQAGNVSPCKGRKSAVFHVCKETYFMKLLVSKNAKGESLGL